MEKSFQRPLITAGSASIASPAPVGTRVQRLRARAMGMRRKAATVVLAGLSLSMGIYAIFGHDGLVAYQQKQHQAQQLHQQILSLQKENERMALHDKRLQSDRDTIEYEAREKMHYTRPGEVIYTLPEAPKAGQGPGKALAASSK
ncbi:MAG: FtsB family cell division protein [Acidobacteriaceae bacterium]